MWNILYFKLNFGPRRYLLEILYRTLPYTLTTAGTSKNVTGTLYAVKPTMPTSYIIIIFHVTESYNMIPKESCFLSRTRCLVSKLQKYSSHLLYIYT